MGKKRRKVLPFGGGDGSGYFGGNIGGMAPGMGGGGNAGGGMFGAPGFPGFMGGGGIGGYQAMGLGKCKSKSWNTSCKTRFHLLS